jgi:hypothetical protein
MMVWTSRILIGVMDGDWQDLGSQVGQICKPTFDYIPIPVQNPTQHKPNESDDPFKTMNYHHMEILKDDGMD